ncbi:MAG TPA: FkbM family methyltransferase [Xanthobacteraceae bacterium]|nr:FkbM family methyltransferase [Xanthobacteraceae bacterium]
MERQTIEPPAIARRTRPPLHWKLAVSARKRWHRLRRLFRKDREIEEVRYFGATFRLSPEDLIGREMVLKRFEWLQITAMLTACRELNPAAFIDVGANFGLYTCIVGRHQPATRVIAFEPNRSVLDGLRAHIALNGVQDVTIHECALGASRQKASLLPGSQGFSALSAIVPSHRDGYEIDVVALDDLFSFAGKPIVMKIDVEGYELEVLQGAKILLAQNYGYAQIESFEKERADAVIDFMARHGWRQSDHIVDDLIFRRAATE